MDVNRDKDLSVKIKNSKRIRLFISIALIIMILIISSAFVSAVKFEVINPFSSSIGLMRILFTDVDYVVIQNSPKVILSKPGWSVSSYFELQGYSYFYQLGSDYIFKKENSLMHVQVSSNSSYYSRFTCFKDIQSKTAESNMQVNLKTAASENIDYSKNYKAINTGSSDKPNYHYYVSGFNGKIIDDGDVGKEPKIQKINNNILKLVFGVGDSYQVQFFDLEKNVASDLFETPKMFDVEKDLVVYMDFDGDKLKLIICSIFDKTKLFNEYIRDFSPVAVPQNALSEAMFINDKQLKITYLEGKDRVVKEEVINYNLSID